MRKKIAIVTGGDSSEFVISLKSANQVQQHLDRDKYESFIVFIRKDDWHVRLDPEGWEKIPIDRDTFSFTWKDRTIRPDFAFIALHGPPGENGQLQDYFDKLDIPYSTSGARSLELSFNKYNCKKEVRKAGILTADAVLIRKIPNKTGKDEWQMITGNRTGLFDPELIIDRVGLPCFIKPNAGGSSFGVSRTNHANEFERAIKKALEEDDEVLVEAFIPGNELTCGVLKTPAKEFIFPVTEIISRNEFFDYEAKYTVGMADEVTPAEIHHSLATKCESTSSRIYDLLDCRGLVRIDFINREGDLYFLELNGVPGMSRESIVPKQIRTMGHTESEIYDIIIQETAGW
jgi:D-alanine-D-alanine ligase